MTTRPHLLGRKRFLILPVLLVPLLGGHGVILYYGSSQVGLSAALLLGAVILLVIKHLGLLGPVYAIFRRRHSRKGP